MDNDTSWCPVCDRQIQPKRFQVAVPQPTPPAPTPAPPPSSPVRRTKGSGTIRQRGGGLVQGTGRVKPNGSLKRSDTARPAPQPVPIAPVKLRTVIDQGPTPLYCSDECQLADINRGLPHDFNPDRERSSTSSPVPFSTRAPTESDSTGSSFDSESSIESASSQTTHMSPSLATLAAIYHFPPLPPPAPFVESTPTPLKSSNEYSSGIMMAGRKIAAELCHKPQKSEPYGGRWTPPVERKPIPGWTDGSNAWRSSVYSVTAPNSSSSSSLKSFSARSSSGVQSTLTSSASFPRPSLTRGPASLPGSDADMLGKFSQSFNRRASHVSLPSSSSSPAPPSSVASSAASFVSTPSYRKKERSLVHRGAEGKLLVPDVVMRVNSSASSSSLSSQWSGPSSRRSVRSPLSQSSALYESDEDDRTQRSDSAASLPHVSKRPPVETRSWSYDNIKTYPIMPLPIRTKKEKRIEKKVVDGKEVEVEVEIEVEEKLKRLFLFGA
ncbi:hypothetical protein Hypma_000847 [Hypsizygus marmoreus]|uniref:Uncharacterized protein n=1 Tax=Hypsizygus marmoreus TaxID=39966 RepID=A0A369JDR8_HYPMA|nr:hypothetical protein Hypma_000847 [Hypsizygus marmoreus]